MMESISEGAETLVKPCRECEKEFRPGKCGYCPEWESWFPSAWNNACAWIRRELELAEERHAADVIAKSARTYTYREIVFGTVFTELWR